MGSYSNIAVYVVTKHDRNGNPRRGWILFYASDSTPAGMVYDFVEEGYAGRPALTGKYPSAVDTLRIEVPPAEFNRLRRAGAAAREARGDV